MPKVVITMPAYKAEDTLAKTVADIPDGLADELILVDDASTDETAGVARELGLQVIVHPENRGYGGNQKTCYTEALRTGADIVVMLHPDYQYDPKAVPLLIAPILAGDADMTFGSRFAGLGDPMSGGMPLYRFLGNRITTTLENLMLGSRFTDMHSGLRAYTRRCLQSLPFMRYSDDFWFDGQLLVDAVTSGQRVVEVPIPTRYTKESSSISVGRSLKYIAGSLAYCAKQTAERGRRGRRNQVNARKKRARLLPGHRSIERECVLCGGRAQRLVYPATAEGTVPVEEFRCTTEALGEHDDIIQCERCRLISSLPTLSREAIIENYGDVVDEEYLREEAGRRELFDWFAAQTAGYSLKGKRLLEIGSNVGMFLDVARARGWNARGIEPSKWAVEYGRERYGVDLRRGTVEELDEPGHSADVVVMMDVLEHLADPVEGLKRLRPVLDEGILVLSTVNVESIHARARDANWPWFIRSHLYYFSPETLRAVLERAGFRIIEWTTVPRSFHVSYVAQRGRASFPRLARAAEALTRVADPKIPVGLLGDIAMVIARPVSRA
jgi:glycosyltransferase involved in cell wall biosynthesis/2-polyprenyl-3-methyl-5-hydroxy-6-metoxy-1,4-benzoquinol methylase